MSALATVLALSLVAVPEPTASSNLVLSGGHWAGGIKAAQDTPSVKPVDIVILVDQSGSISAEDLERQRAAASSIAQAEFAPDSVVSIVGFASEDGPGQSPVDVVCPPTTVGSAQDRQFLSDCVGQLTRREQNEGNGTDHPAALAQALSYLTGSGPAADRPKLIFLLTDGVLDVSNSPRYGADNVNNRRNVAAQAELDTQLEIARANGVQVWPLGFGNVDTAQLDYFASSGAQGICGPDAPRPRAVVVASSADIDEQLLTAFGAARCAGVGPLRHSPVRPGETIDVPVTIPLIATDGAIVVFKRHPRVGVQYLDPAGTVVPKSGTAQGSTFQVSGENGAVEALRVVDPVPGEWTVRITVPADLTPLEVGTTVIYQGAVRVSMTTDPPSPQAGQPVAVSLRLATRNRVIVDPDLLRGFSFSAELSGEGFAPLQVADFRDDGVGPDLVAGDGVFTGQVTIPASATGALTFVGQVSGVGISGDTRELHTQVASGRADIRAVVGLPGADQVAPGESVSLTAELTNDSGRSRDVRLLLVDPSPGTRLSIPEAVHEIPASGSRIISFTVRVEPDSALGPNLATLRVVDDARPETVFYSGPVSLNVGYPFPWLLALGVSALVLAIAVGTAIWWRQRRAGDVRGLVVKLYRRGVELGDLAAPDEPARAFWFLLRDDEPVPELLPAGRSDPDAYRVSRPGGAPVLRTPFGENRSWPLGTRLNLTPELALELVDENELARLAPAPAPAGSWAAGVPGTAAGTAAAGTAGVASAPGPASSPVAAGAAGDNEEPDLDDRGLL